MKTTTKPTAPPAQLERARCIVSGIQPASVRAALTVGRAVRRAMNQHPAFSELMALCHVAETRPATYALYACAVRRDPAFAQMTMPLSTFVERFDAALSTTSIAA